MGWPARGLTMALKRRRQQAYALLPRRQEGRSLPRVLEGAYEKIRAEERGLRLELSIRPNAIGG